MYRLKCLLVILCFSSTQILFAADVTNPTGVKIQKTTDQVVDEQKAACDKNTAMEWSSKLGRCVGRQAAIDTRNEAKACDALGSVAAKEKCHIALAEKNTGLSSDTASLNKGKLGSSMMMNGIMAAYTITNMVGGFAKDEQKSTCTSTKIFAVTAIAGLASDVFLKMKAKKKVKELEGKYKLDTTSSAHEAQVKALEYLKEEQKTVVSIAGAEKKRNLLLMIGYGLAAGWAVYEVAFSGNPDCHKSSGKDSEADPAPEAGEQVTVASQTAAPPPVPAAAAPAPTSAPQ